ncbi:MAG: alpha/beta hydrolase [Tepidiformaceae bacterium]
MAAATPDYGLIDRAGGGSSIFYPRPDGTTPPRGAEDLAFEVEPAVTLGARLYTFDPTFATVLYFHGNGEVVGDHDEIAPMYGEVGANLLVVDFRGYGRSDGRPSFATLVSDGPLVARRFHSLLDERGLSATRLVMGRSLGAHPALEIAANAGEGFAGMVIESGAGNLRRLVARVGEGAEGVADLVAAHEAKIRTIALPALFIHGEQDDLIPVSSAAETFDLVGTERKEFVVLPGVGHNDLLWRRYTEYFAAIEEFLSQLP